MHGIADAEDAASIALLPAGGQQRDQLELGARSVLEFIQQDVLQTIVEPQTEVRRCVRRTEGAQRRQGYRRKIRRALLSKHLIQFRRGQHQHLRHFANPPPLLIAVERRRQVANFHEDLPRLRIAIEFLQQILHRRLIGTLRRKALLLGEPPAKLAFRGQQQAGNATPAREIRRVGPQGHCIIQPSGQIRPIRTRAARCSLGQSRQYSQSFLADDLVRAVQHSRHQ